MVIVIPVYVPSALPALSQTTQHIEGQLVQDIYHACL